MGMKVAFDKRAGWGFWLRIDKKPRYFSGFSTENQAISAQKCVVEARKAGLLVPSTAELKAKFPPAEGDPVKMDARTARMVDPLTLYLKNL